MYPPLLQHAASLSQPSGLLLLYSKEAFECDNWADRRSHPKHANSQTRQNQALPCMHACVDAAVRSGMGGALSRHSGLLPHTHTTCCIGLF